MQLFLYIILLCCSISSAAANISIKILPVPTISTGDDDASRIFSFKDAVSLTKAIELGLEYNTDLISKREALISYANNLKYAFETYQPSLGEFALSTTVASCGPDCTRGERSSPQTTVTLPGLNYSMPTGTSVSLSLPSYTATPSAYSFRSNKPTGANVSVTQQFLQGGSYDVNMATIRNSVLSNISDKFDVVNSYISTTRNIIKAYRTLQMSKKTLAIYTRSEAELKNLESITEKQVKSGDKNELDLVERKIARAKQSILTKTSSTDYNISKINFISTTLGLSPKSDINIADFTSAKLPELQPLAYYVDMALKYNIAHRKLYLNVEKAHNTLIQSQDQTRWQLSASLSSDLTGELGTNTASLNLSIPVSQTSQQNTITQNRLSYMSALRQFKKSKSTVVTDTVNSYKTVQTLYDNFKLEQLKFEQSIKSTQIASTQYKRGEISSVDLGHLIERNIKNKKDYYDAWITTMSAVDDLLEQSGLLLSHYGIKLESSQINYADIQSEITPP